MTLFPVDQRYELADGTLVIETLPGVQFLHYDPKDISDIFIPANFRIYPESSDALTAADIDDLATKFDLIHIFKNHQYIDTGYREHNSNNKKRYREIQLKLNNISQNPLKFYTEFLIDGDLRKPMYKYTTVHNQDPQDPDYGLITVVRELVDPAVLPGTTILGPEDDFNTWTLDQSAFPDLSFWKIRLPVSGKGYSPRIKFISYNEKRYELLTTNWVFRPLYSR